MTYEIVYQAKPGKVATVMATVKEVTLARKVEVLFRQVLGGKVWMRLI